jgi:phosphate starvation-inducible membrane PsiE
LSAVAERLPLAGLRERVHRVGNGLVEGFAVVALFVIGGTIVWSAVLFLLYVGITALTRYMAVDGKELPLESVLTVAAWILLLAIAVLLLRIADSRYAAPPDKEDNR